MSVLSQLLNEYGYFTLFFALMLELVCVPIPNEALLSYVGILSFHQQMDLVLSLCSAGAGGVVGATISYWIGFKLGVPFFRKYGRYIHMGPEKMERVAKWYRKYGKVLLVFSFFIPGIRHIASIISGVIRLPIKSFCMFAYIGVFLWTGTFITLGYVLGPEWDRYQDDISKWLVLTSIFLGIVLLIYIVIRAKREYIKESLLLLFQATFKRYRSFLKIKLFIFLVLTVFLLLVTLMIGMVQHLIANEFVPFDKIVTTIFSFITDSWPPQVLQHIFVLSSWPALSVLVLFTAVMIVVNNKEKWLELLFLGLTLSGGILFSKSIRWLFRFMLEGSYISSDFPNAQSMMFLISYGYFLMMLIRHQNNYLISIIEFTLFFILLFVYSISGVSNYQITPSDLAAGYVFGAVWLSGLILSLELFRFLTIIKKSLPSEM
ncbi:DedA family protein [Sporolactobacillus shoreicorticis]|uniref:DedA family protein n=1 Tax=Sporolactobacillus shoreicorticis TaxID=1923877 RepID=A0ABW5S3Z3_9BACL|nr:DedA family protein [Sporolactobacillus shoreicorticis]MCO7125864.1 DedA family protein [Sporolactobacillus shoreicorticis]